MSLTALIHAELARQPGTAHDIARRLGADASLVTLIMERDPATVIPWGAGGATGAGGAGGACGDGADGTCSSPRRSLLSACGSCPLRRG